jgi:hypothetical protein
VPLVFLILIVSITCIVLLVRVDNVDVAATSFFPIILFGVFIVRYIELIYQKGI